MNKKRKLNLKGIFAVIIVFIIIVFGLYYLSDVPISNIYVIGEYNMKDIDIIREAGLIKYPSSLLNSKSIIEKRLSKNISLKNIKVKKKWLTQVYIYVDDNYGLFYDEVKDITYMSDGREYAGYLESPRLVNDAPAEQYNFLKRELLKVEPSIASKISSIRYYPNGKIDPNRFLLIMTDGNYVHLTLGKFSKLNNYFEVIDSLDNKKGILYLDSGSSFTVIE